MILDPRKVNEANACPPFKINQRKIIGLVDIVQVFDQLLQSVLTALAL